MSQTFFIIENDQQVGPFDIISMVKKIKSGRLKKDDLVVPTDSDVRRRALDIPELSEFFLSTNQEKPNKSEASTPAENVSLDLIKILKEAGSILIDNLDMTYVAGSALLVTALVGYISSLFLPAFLSLYFSSTVFGGCYFVSLCYALQIAQSRDTSGLYWEQFFKQHFRQVFGTGAVVGGLAIGFPCMLGAIINPIFYFLAIPALIIFSLFTLAPFVLTHSEDKNFKAALKISFDLLKHQGLDAIGVVAMLVFINLIAALLLFIPIFVVLPISCIGIALVYERHFSV